MTFFLSYSSRNYSHFLKDIEKTISKRFNVNQRTVQGKVQFKKIKFTKAERFRWRVQARPPTRRGKVQVAWNYVLSGQRKCKKGDAVEIGSVEAMTRSIFLEIFLILHEKVEFFFVIRYLIINFNILF